MNNDGQRTTAAGIIGLSWIGGDRAGDASGPTLGTATPYSHASAMAAVGDIDVRAVCDVSPEARQEFADNWSSLWPEVAAYDNVDAMLAEPLDLVSIVTPDHLHAEMIESCVEAGVGMIFTEKPFTTDLADADRLLDLIEERNTTVTVNHTWRWRPDIVETRAIVRSGELGSLSQVSIEAGGPRAMLFRNLTHFIDLAIHIAGSNPLWVMGELEPGTGDYGLVYSGDGGSDPRRDPGAWMTIGFDAGVRGHVSGLKASPADVVIQVQCEGGRVTIDALGARVVANPRTNDGTPGSVGGPAVRPLRPRHTMAGMQAGLADLIESHRRGRQTSGSAREARETIAVIDALLRSSQEHGRVGVRQRTAQ